MIKPIVWLYGATLSLIIYLPAKTLASNVAEQTAGRVLLQVEQHGEAWYINPVDGKRYYLGRPRDAWQIMIQFGIGVTDSDLNQIDRNTPGKALPSSVLLGVPFTSQAPYGNWDTPYSEACEEASLAMVEAFLQSSDLSSATANQRILEIVNWEMGAYGYHADTSADVTARTARDYLVFNAVVSHAVTKQHIKTALSQGKPIIAPVYGKALNNPHYRNGGPYYHMMVIIGYDGSDFITHDPGTMYGEHYRYNADLFVSAIHDLGVPESDTASATPAIIIIKP